jgi:Tol biopolymer transport system component
VTISIRPRPTGKSVQQAATSAALVVAMALFGIGTFKALESLRGSAVPVQRPASSLVAVPGTVYLAQGGAIYRLNRGSFKQITPEDGWSQPAASPDGSELVAIKRSLNSSDLYLLGAGGQVDARLTNNASGTVEANHWAFYPRFSPDGSSVFFSYDAKDPYNSYRLDLAIYSRPSGKAPSQLTAWTQPNAYTGGDIGPLPLGPQGLVFTRFSIDAQSQVHSQVWLQAGPGSPGVGLTQPGDDCAQPAISLDRSLIAMVCRHGQLRTADLVLAPLDLSSGRIGAPVTIVTGKLVASPSFSADGSALAFLAPALPGGQFQLWTVATPPSGSPGKPTQVTQNLGFDSISAPVWLGS